MSESLKDALSEIVFSCRVLSQGRDVTIAEIDSFLSGPIATAPATTAARARREALEEAAGVCEAMHEGFEKFSPGHTSEMKALSMAWVNIRALATTPPEDRQTEAAP